VINEGFNGFNILQQDISKVGALDIGFYNSLFSSDFNKYVSEYISQNSPVVFLLGSDDIDHKILEKSFLVYMGHHGDKSAQIADIILPTPAFTEKSSTFINLEGRVLQTSKCYHPLGQAKDEWKIFRSLSNNFSKKLKFNNLSELREEIISKFPLFKEINVLPSMNKINFGSPSQIKNRIIDYNIKNFYMNDVISRHSVTMANCSKEILNEIK